MGPRRQWHGRSPPASVIAQVERLARTPTLQTAWKEGREVFVHGWVYGLKDGLLSDLRCSIGKQT
ncbi:MULTISPECIES: carbonic anhydrase [unclassified Rhizobium]|uniref:carbonic anhydrase n=1 Tax=unclassified Rhizobium TaxID=2613769 RepID=UPI003807845C